MSVKATLYLHKIPSVIVQEFLICLLLIMKLKYDPNLKIYNTKVNWSASEVIFMFVICYLDAVFACFKTKTYSKKRLIYLIFPFLSNSWKKKGNMRNGTEIANPRFMVAYISFDSLWNSLFNDIFYF